jgi:hypothetical protein
VLTNIKSELDWLHERSADRTGFSEENIDDGGGAELDGQNPREQQPWSGQRGRTSDKVWAKI